MRTCSRILLIEDDADSAEALCLLLRAHGIDAEWAASGREAIEIFGSHPPGRLDGIIVDLMLPDLDGVTLVERLREIGPVPPIVVHSAASKQVTDESGTKVKAAAVLRKPVTWREMREVLERCGVFPQVEAG